MKKLIFALLLFVPCMAFSREIHKREAVVNIDATARTLKITKATDTFEMYSDVGAHQHEMVELDGNSVEWNIHFTRKPLSNRIRFRVKDWQKYSFWYQGELTKKEKEIGCIRPDDVVGSYAVYYSDGRRDNEWGTGKVCHIKRPWAIDDKGEKVWCSMEYDKGVLTVDIPEAWFNDHNVVMLDPEIGYSGEGGSAIAANAFYMQRTASASGTLSNAHLYARGDGGNTAVGKLALYTDSSDAPNALISGSTSAELGSFAAGVYSWDNSTEGLSATVTQGTKYWVSAAGSSYCYLAYDIAGEDACNFKTGTSYATYPLETAVSNALGDWRLSFYFDFTSSAGTVTPPTLPSIMMFGAE